MIEIRLRVIRACLLAIVCACFPGLLRGDEPSAEVWRVAVRAVGDKDVDGFRIVLSEHPSLAKNPRPGEGGGDFLLTYAAECDFVEGTNLLLDSGADINCSDAISRRTALQISASHSRLEIAKVLIARGADISKFDSKRGPPPPLGCAASRGRFEMVDLLLKNGASLKYGHRDATALHSAMKFLEDRESGKNVDIQKVVQSLVEAGADVNAQDSLGLTPLYVAAWSGSASAMESLVRSGGPQLVPDLASNDGTTPVAVVVGKSWAAARARVERDPKEDLKARIRCLNVLRKLKADFSSVDRKGQTALLAAQQIEDPVTREAVIQELSNGEGRSHKPRRDP